VDSRRKLKLHEHRSEAKSKSNMIEKDHAKMTLQGSAKKSGIRALEFK
jgi:hypothetical protein